MKLLSDEKVISALTQAFQDKPSGGLMPEEFRAVIADAKEDIVRCGNCKYYKGVYCKYIYQINVPHSPGFYCGWGERKSWEDPSHPCADSVMMGD